MQIYSIFINTISSRSFLKVASIIFAYILWSIVSNYNYYSVKISVPIAFYNSKNTNIFSRISCPETVFIELYAKKHNIKKLDIENIAVHIDMQNLKNTTGHEQRDVIVFPLKYLRSTALELLICLIFLSGAKRVTLGSVSRMSLSSGFGEMVFFAGTESLKVGLSFGTENAVTSGFFSFK